MSAQSHDQELAVILISGGMDSLVTAAYALQSYRGAFLHIDYGQRTAGQEKSCFTALVAHYKPEFHQIFELPWLGNIGGSALTDHTISVPQTLTTSTHIPVTYVPFRNSIMLSTAVAWAEVIGASVIFYGAVEADSAGYPDCRQKYVAAFNQLITVGTARVSIEIQAPLITMSKKEIVLLGAKLQVPFELTWSCYTQAKRACGLCESCRLRLEAFSRAGLPDPLPYQTRP
ncbi:7-cyano-7-deazaguanine synthase QueC [candidate division CSSED10-310 bacterium]|uniref:7-cyano-7-deazaguanine synthase n=1 Tax=candidate division CSSED10-310 bacterium TaxID=2855610 RepID=A0ABV6Z6R9_UNCC1